jgi:hypothetical protein
VELVLGAGVFILAWRWLKALLPHIWALGGALLVTVVISPLLISLLVTTRQGLVSLPFWGVLLIVLLILIVGGIGYWLGRNGFLAEDRPL